MKVAFLAIILVSGILLVDNNVVWISMIGGGLIGAYVALEREGN